MITERWFKIWQKWTAKDDSPARVSRRELQGNREAMETAEEVLEQRSVELAQAQGQLEEERRRYQELFDLAPQAYLETDELGLIQEANQAVATLLVKQAKFLKEIPLVLFVASGARSEFYELLRRLKKLRDAKTQEYLFQMQRADGRLFEAAITVRVSQNAQGRTSLHWMINDVTARRRVETALQSAHESLLYHVKRQTTELAVVKATMTEEWEVRQRVEREALVESQVLNQTVEERTAKLAETHASLAQEVAERQRVEREMVQRNRELAALNRVSSALSDSLELPAVMGVVKASALENLEVEGGLIYLYDKSQQRFWLYDHWGSGREAAGLKYLNAAGLPLEAIVQEKEKIFPELATLAAGGTTWSRFLFLPLVARNEAQGAICLMGATAAVFGEGSRLFFENLGQQVAVAIQNARLYEQVREGRERLRQLAQQIVTIQEQERHRVSRELHDEAGQALAVLKFSLEVMMGDLPPDGVDAAKAAALRQQLVEVLDVCETMMARIRRLAHHLRPAALDDLGLNAALEGLCHDFNEHTHLRVAYDGGEIEGLTDAVDISLYRFVQEALTNVVKHAQAKWAWVALSADEDGIRLSVRDDGQGFDGAWDVLPGRMDGMGLAGVRERLQPLGGRLEIHSTVQKGTSLVAYVPRP